MPYVDWENKTKSYQSKAAPDVTQNKIFGLPVFLAKKLEIDGTKIVKIAAKSVSLEGLLGGLKCI